MKKFETKGRNKEEALKVCGCLEELLIASLSKAIYKNLVIVEKKALLQFVPLSLSKIF